jgi:hypothetical protein
MSFDDELLMTTLGGALETRAAQPSAAELDDFRALVLGDGGEVLPFPELVAPRRGHTVLVAAALAASLMIVGGASALATGATFPNVLRSPVRALGIPIDDTQVAKTRSAMAELRAALDGTDDTRVDAAAVALAAKLKTLSAADLAEVETQAAALLRVAITRLNVGLGRVHTDTTVAPPATEPLIGAEAPSSGDTSGSVSSGEGETDGGSVSPVAEPEHGVETDAVDH